MLGIKRDFVFLIILSFAFSIVFSVDVPRTVNYQGKLFDSGSGGPVSGMRAIGYRLYKDCDGDHSFDSGGCGHAVFL